MNEEKEFVCHLSTGVSVSINHAVVHLKFEQGETVFTSEMTPEIADALALRLVQAAADARAMEAFRNLLFSEELGKDRLPLGSVRKILRAMSVSRNIQTTGVDWRKPGDE